MLRGAEGLVPRARLSPELRVSRSQLLFAGGPVNICGAVPLGFQGLRTASMHAESRPSFNCLGWGNSQGPGCVARGSGSGPHACGSLNII